MPYHNVFRNMMILALGSGGAKILGLLAMPVLTRLYSPENFGVMSAFIALSVIFAPVLTLRYATSIPLYRRSSSAINAVFLSVVIAVVISILLMTFVSFWWRDIVSLLRLQELGDYFLYFIVSVIFISFNEIVAMWFTRKKKFKVISLGQVLQAMSGLSVKLAMGFLVGGAKVLVVGQIIQQSTAFFYMLKEFLYDIRESISQLSLKRMKKIAYLQRGYPIYRLPSHFLMTFSMQSPVLFITALYGSGDAGQIGLAMMALALPVTVVGQTAGQAYYAEIAKRKKEQGAVLKITKDVSIKLFALSIVPALILYYAGESVFVIVFGEEWAVAGRVASIMSVYLAAQFVANPLTNIFNIAGRQDFFLYINVCRAALVLGVFIGFGDKLDFLGLVGVYAWSMFAYYAMNVAVIIKVACNHEKIR